MLIFRLGAAERSHLIEYSVLAIFVHNAYTERLGTKRSFLAVGGLAFLTTSLLGMVDEGIQFFIPQRIFDPEDIVFNMLAAFTAVGGSMVLRWARKKLS